MRLRGQEWLQKHVGLMVGLTTFLLAFLVYGFTLARDITWANYGVDGGDLITAVVTHGNPHPSGYPTYLLLGYLVEKLPLWPIALRFNLFSALTMAGAAGCIATIAHTPTITRDTATRPPQPFAAIAAGLALAFATLIWGQAVITEVYGVFILLSALFLWAMLTEKPAWLTGLFLGLAITSHLTGWLLLPLALILMPKKRLGSFISGLLLGLLPFALLPLLSTSSSPVVWGNLNTIQGWWWLVSSQLYRGYGFSLPPDLWLPRLSEWGLQIMTQFTWAGIPLIFAAFFLVTSKQRRLYLLLLGTAVFYFIIAFFYHTDDAIIFTLPAWLLLSLLLLPALQRLGWIALILPLVLLLINFQANNLKDDTLIRAHAESLLESVPEMAIIETPGDPTIFTLWYMIYAEEQRTDIIPVDSDLFAFDWYRDRLQLLYPELESLERDNLTLFRERNQLKRPYCLASLAQTESNSAYSLTCTENTNS